MPSRIYDLGLSVALLPVLLAGCAAISGAPKPVADAEAEISALSELNAPAVVALCAAGLKRTGNTTTAMQSEEALGCRNQIVSARRYAIDLRFVAFEQDYFQENRWTGFAATLASIGLGGAGAFSGATAARALAAASGGLAGGRAAYDREILSERALLTINAAMRSERDRIAARIVSGLRMTVVEYPLATALSDLEAYQRAGTVLGALVTLNQSAGVQAQAAEQALDRASGFATAAPSAYLQGLITAEATSTARQAVRTRIATEMRKLGLELNGATLTNFLTDEQRVAEHRVLARSLGWRPE